MASIDNRKSPLSAYDASSDCSHASCTITCRQFCYWIFPPPPPSDDDSRPAFSPLIISIIALLASAFLLVAYYVIVRRYCRRRRSAVEIDENRNELGQDLWRIASPAGLDEAVIKAIAVCKYRKGDGMIEGTECAVCLGEFREGEALRLLPRCSHAFHAPCIDAWLKSHPNCPLCRATVLSSSATTPASSQTSSNPTNTTNAYQIQRPDDLVLVVEDFNRTAMLHQDGGAGNLDCGNDPGQLRRCVSLGDFPNQRKLLISDILKFEDIDECDLESRSSIGSSRGLSGMKRSISAGRDI